MGLTIVLEDERGETLEQADDPTNILHRLLPSSDDQRYQHLGMIDWYGDTVFNNIQAPRFLAEWRQIASKASGPEEHALMRAVEAMALRVANGAHIYLKFYGD